MSGDVGAHNQVMDYVDDVLREPQAVQVIELDEPVISSPIEEAFLVEQIEMMLNNGGERLNKRFEIGDGDKKFLATFELIAL